MEVWDIFNYILGFLFFWLHWVFVAAHRLSLVVMSGGHSFLQCAGLLTGVASPVAEQGSGARGFP